MVKLTLEPLCEALDNFEPSDQVGHNCSRVQAFERPSLQGQEHSEGQSFVGHMKFALMRQLNS